jgi:hypothetical protein
MDLIKRIGAIELTRPRLDTAAVAAAIDGALAAAGLPSRPLHWFADSISAHRHVWAVATAAARQAAERIIAEAPGRDLDVPARKAALAAAWEPAWRRIHEAAPKKARRAVFQARPRVRAREWTTWDTGQAAARAVARGGILDAGVRAATSAANKLAHQASTAAFKAPPDGIRGEISRAAAWATWRAAPLQNCAWSAHDGAIRAVAYLNTLQVFDHPAQAQTAALLRPMIDACVAGLYLYWVTPDEVICVPRPAFRATDGIRGGPALEWPSGEAYVCRSVKLAA